MGRNPLEQAMVSMWNTKIEQNGIVAVGETFRNRAEGMRDRALPGPIDLAQIPELVERGRIRVEAFLNRMDDQLDGNRFITGDRFTMADITAFVTVEFAQRLKIPISDSQRNLQRWYNDISSRGSTKA
jgi:glutathione S-transferase